MKKYTREELEALAQNVEWAEIIPVEQAKVIDTIALKDGTFATVREIVIGSDKLMFVMNPDKPEIFEIKPNGSGKPWSKFEALKHLMFAGDHNKTVGHLSARFDVQDTSLAYFGRELVGERLRDSLDIPPSERGTVDPEFADMVARKQYEMEANDLAKERMRTAALDREPDTPHPLRLADFLEQREETNDYLIDGLAGNGSTSIVHAQAKVGKSTFAGNLTRALADHEPFLDWFPTRKHVGSIGYMNYELSAGQCRRWFRDMAIKNVHKVAVWNLRGEANPLRSREAMLEFAETVAPLGIETLIIDPFSGAFIGDTNSNDEVKRFLLHLEEFKVAAGITNLILVVHAGNDASRPRGATTLRDHPDALWSLSKDNSGRRYFKAEGRDVAVDEGELLFDSASRRLTFVPSSGRRASVDALKEAILEFIMTHPGCKAKDVDSAFRASKERKAALRNELLLEGKIEFRDGGRNSKLFYPVARLPVVPESFREDGRLKVSSSSPLSIGGTTAGGRLTEVPHGCESGSTSHFVEVACEEFDWKELLRVAGL